MFIKCMILFENSRPKADEFLNELVKNTGLTDLKLEYTGGDNMSLIHPFFADSDFSIVFPSHPSKKDIMIWSTVARIDFLMEASIFAFTQLGGKVDFAIDPLAKCKWHEVADLYKAKDIISDEDVDWMMRNT